METMLSRDQEAYSLETDVREMMGRSKGGRRQNRWGSRCRQLNDILKLRPSRDSWMFPRHGHRLCFSR